MTEVARTVIDTAWIFEGHDGAITLAKAAAASESQALSEDPYNYTDGEGGLERPPYDMDGLIALMGARVGGYGNSLHTRCVKQKASDTVGRGIELRAKEDGKGDGAEETRWQEFLEQVEDDERGEGSFKERITWAHEDFEAVGWGVLEVGRRKDGTLDGLWHLPGHTIRAHHDGRRYAQKRGGKITWFKRFGLKGDVDREKGTWSDRSMSWGSRGNEVIVVRNYSPASSYYGLPDHIPALMALAGWTAQAMFNYRFFGNQAVPSYAVIVEGADMSPELEALITDHFRRIKGDPARTIIIPLPYVPGLGENLQPRLRFERLSVDIKEASFRMYRQDTALEICISHGVPPYRIGWPLMGSLGGATAQEMTQIYNDAIVQPRQETWEQRLDRALLGAKGLDIKTWGLKCAELDVRNEMLDLQKSEALYRMGAVTPAEIASFHGYERSDPASKEYIQTPLAPGVAALPPPPDGTETQMGPDGMPVVPPAAAVVEEVTTAVEEITEEVAARWSGEVVELAGIRKMLVERLGLAEVDKHGDHDQSTHGNRDGGSSETSASRSSGSTALRATGSSGATVSTPKSPAVTDPGWLDVSKLKEGDYYYAHFYDENGKRMSDIERATRASEIVADKIGNDPNHPLYEIYYNPEDGHRYTPEERAENASNRIDPTASYDVGNLTMEQFRELVQPTVFYGKVPEPEIPAWSPVTDSGTGNSRIDPFITSNPDRFAEAIAQGKFADLQQPRGVSTLVDELASISLTAAEQGEKAPAIDLGKVTINGTNIFLGESLGIPRVEMPQLTGKPDAGSPADDMPKDERGEVNLADAFTQYLEGKGVDVANEIVPAEWLRASQKEIDGVKTGGIAMSIINGVNGTNGQQPEPAERRIFVTKDDYILDGHHTWSGILAAQLAEGVNHEVKVSRIDMGISEALREATAWTTEMGIGSRALGKRRRSA